MTVTVIPDVMFQCCNIFCTLEWKGSLKKRDWWTSTEGDYNSHNFHVLRSMFLGCLVSLRDDEVTSFFGDI